MNSDNELSDPLGSQSVVPGGWWHQLLGSCKFLMPQLPPPCLTEPQLLGFGPPQVTVMPAKV